MPMARASGRGKIPMILMNGQAAAYSSRCRIREAERTRLENHFQTNVSRNQKYLVIPSAFFWREEPAFLSRRQKARSSLPSE